MNDEEYEIGVLLSSKAVACKGLDNCPLVATAQSWRNSSWDDLRDIGPYFIIENFDGFVIAFASWRRLVPESFLGRDNSDS